MAASHGTDAVLEIADSTDVSRDLSAYITEDGLDRTASVEDVTAHGGRTRKYIAGFKDGVINLAGNFDPTIDGYLSGILGVDGQAYLYYPAGTPVGATKPKYSGVGILTSYKIVTPMGKATFTATFQLSDTVTRAVA